MTATKMSMTTAVVFWPTHIDLSVHSDDNDIGGMRECALLGFRASDHTLCVVGIAAGAPLIVSRHDLLRQEGRCL